MKVKVCGMGDEGNLALICQSRPDYIGFILYEASPRFMRDRVATAQVVAAKQFSKTVGVLVNAPIDIAQKACDNYQFDFLQLHGDETPDYCHTLRKQEVNVIKAFGISTEFHFGDLEPYYDAADFFLFDTRTEKYGGSGQSFEWQLLDQYQGPLPYFLSGGIGPEHLEALRTFTHPYLHAIDVNSRFETVPGIKDHKLIDTFIKAVRHEI